MAQQDNLMQSLIAYFLGSESAKLKAGSGGSPFAGSSGPSGSGGSAGLTSGLPAGLAGITLPSASLASLQAQVQAHAQMHQQQLNATETQLQIAVQQHKVAQAAASGEGENQQQQGQGQYHQQQGQGQGLQQVQRDPSITAHMANMGVHGHEVGRATLMQMSELSRRASANGGGAGNGPVYVPPPPAGVGGGGGGGNSNASGNGLGGWNRGAQGGQGGGLEQQLLQQGMAPPKMTRAEALAKIEEVQREREREREKGRRWSTGTGTGPADVSFGRDMSRERGVDGVDPGVGRALGEKVGGNGNNDMSNNSSSSSSNNNVSAMESSMLHEGLQVYTVGQLMPRGMYPEDSFSVFGAPSNASNSANSSGANWSFDPTGLAGGGLLAGLGIGNMDSPAMASTSGSVASTSRDGEGGDDGVDADGGRLTRARARRAGGSGSGSGSGSNSDEDYEEEEVVRPSQNVTDENGALVAVSSDENAGAGVSKQDGGGAGSGGGGGVLGGGRGILARRRGAKGKGRAGGVGDNDEYMLVLQAAGAQAVSSAGSGSGSGSQKLRVRRSTFVPAWAIPPRVLLVDDDAVSRKLSSKFLQVFGCTTDVAVDGVGAVTKMNLEKYDLVLMDIVMPKLDGVSATSMIRKFDQGTPIISMTSNSKPNEIMTYYSSGMNDILPKPFTKQGLLDVLEKHLIHLKGIQRISKSVPRGPGIPPLSDGGVQQALAAHSREWGVQGLMGGGGNQLMDGAMDPNMSLSLGPLSSSQPSSANPSFNFNFYNDGSGNGGGSGNSPGGNNGPAGGEEVEGLEFEGRMNPLAAMGFSNDQYAVMMQNFLNGEGLGASGSGSGSSGEYSAGSSPASANSSFGMMGQTPATATGLSMGMGMGMGAGGGMGGGTMMYGVGINFGDNSGGTTMNFMKRGLEDGSELEGPAGKKSRFEVIE
ncbi:hypothetical protein FA15DRAFT_674952 [Coprinopsis marcescibilis]|uniref:Response regulatory domain-containing protein n=1 Tax=Coprinopsis marcescibilis TaxID=230819 RepID=A0A5C3KSV9_COPMA|nr:hypothetical protein FA15DRAFT_674952 [Coprinopsis marcescibilis]